MAIKNQYDNSLFELRKEDLRDRSVLSLIVTNLIIIVWAMIEQWDVVILMWVYWVQSIIIGCFWFLRIITQKNLCCKYLVTANNQSGRMNIFFRLCGGGFFLLHYSGFHFGYFYVLESGLFGLFSQQKTLPVEPLVISACLFFANQIITFLPDRRATVHKKIDFSEFMRFPYVRIIPLHVTIILGGFVLNFIGAKTLVGLRSQLILLVFLFLKTAADVSMYVKQKKGFSRVPSYIDGEGGGPYPQIKQTITGEVLALTDSRLVPLPALAISRSLMYEMEDILANAGINVQRRDLSIEVVPSAKILAFELVCTSVKGDVIILRFSSDEDKKDYAFVSFYLRISKSWKFWRVKEFQKEIKAILKDNGAKDISFLFNGIENKNR